MFSLKKQTAEIAHLNLREEKHGDDDVLAVDVKVVTNVPNDFLSQLHPTLKWSLYSKGEDGQQELVEDKGHLPHLRYSALPQLAWAGTMKGATFVVHGAKKADDLSFEAEVGKLRLECKEGGTVMVTFRASVLPTAEQSGALAALLGQEAKVSVRPSTEEPAGDGDGDAGE